MKTGNILLGVLVGAAVGILLAPDSGSSTRRKLVEAGEDYLDLFKSKIDGLISTATDKINDVKGQAEEFVNKGAEEVADKKEEFKNKIMPNNNRV